MPETPHVNIFNLNFEHWGLFLLSFIPALINIGIFIYVSFFLPLNRTNKLFALFLFLCALVQMLDGLTQMSVTGETAIFWGRSTPAIFLFISPVGLLFTLRFTKLYKKISQPVLYMLLFVPAICLEFLVVSDVAIYTLIKSERWHWVLTPRPSLAADAIYAWTVGVSLINFLLLWSFYLREQKEVKKKQTLLLAAGFSVPFLIGCVTEVIFPFFLDLDDIPLTSPAITAFSVLSIIAIRRYNMLDYSPRHQWENIVNTMNEGLLITNNNEEIMYANKKILEMTGKEWIDLKNKHFFDTLVNKKEVEKYTNALAGDLSGHLELSIITNTGKQKCMILSWAPYYDSNGSKIGSIKILTNISRLKEMERIFSRNHQRLKDAQAIAHVGSWEVNFSTGKSHWSEEACRIYGVSEDNNCHTLESWISFVHPDDLAEVKKTVLQSEKLQKDASFKHRILLHNGVVKHIHSVSKFEFKDGKPVGIFGICRDITEQHNIEQALIRSENNIRSFAAHLNHTIETERGYMAREIHDEFGQYLTGLKLELASLQKKFTDDPVVNERLETLLRETERSQQSIRKIVTKLRPGVLDTLGLIPSMEWLIKDFQKKTTIKVDLKVHSDGSNIIYNSHTSICFFRICQEALTNISRHSKASEVLVEINESRANLILKIADNGVGISCSNLNNPFSTGLLGMKERAGVIGANLQINSRIGAGTAIELELNTKRS